MDMERIKQVGTAAAYNGGRILKEHFGRLRSVRKKGAIDLVTEADLRSEAAIIDTLMRSFPDHAILAEESGRHGSSGQRWIIDPLDGTTNFAHNLPLFCVSIAFAVDDAIRAGFVLAPLMEEFFMAVKGEGALLNGSPISVSATPTLADSLLVTGFPYDHATIFPPLMERFGRGLKATQGVRRLGAAALDLCYVACGRFDGFWEQHLKPWDTAAGFLVASEAGGRTTVFSGAPYSITADEIVSTNGAIHDELLTLLEL
ncbi:inositol monophosphatase [Desulfosarcina ovata subsp. sediminis]|uniref:Inositol-1-monophosphatase n=1 Tax=Desulfosarcina ovata subsp. sediminis TaxID=885957 RepID=A0A5K7ZHM2_9BACT|nr:inositol monophosphatase family protein [Desulfosarcina ovata]BBO79437.1 inositol monophosphatase [Desulfosarcina ovata subsp. sediminis]